MKESREIEKLLHKDVRLSEDVLRTDYIRAHVYADENDLREEEEIDEKGGTKRTGDDGTAICITVARGRGSRRRAEWVFDGHTGGSPTIREGGHIWRWVQVGW